MVELEGKISNHYVLILIDLCASLRYVSPRIFDLFHLKIVRFKSPWLVELAIEDKRRVNAKVEYCVIEFDGQQVKTNLNVLPLDSYDMLIGMDWLEQHWTLVNCKYKTTNFMSNDGNRVKLQGIIREVMLCPIIAYQLGKCMCKGYQIYAVQVGYTNSKDKFFALDQIPVVLEFKDVF